LSAKILIAEDDPGITEILEGYLKREGFEVLTSKNGHQALELAERERPALVLLDLMLPDLDGLAVCRELRAGLDVAIVMVTARTEEADKLLGLELGADDYITKPFSPREVVARVKAVLRRVNSKEAAEEDEKLVLDDLIVDLTSHQVKLRGREINLTPTEFKILEAMVRHPGRVFTRGQLLELVQDYAYEGYERTMDTHIKNLRKKIEPDPKNPRYLQTVFGVGYRLVKDHD